MSKQLFDSLPPELRELLSGQDLETKAGETFYFLTVGEDGWPNVALLSVGEVLARSPTDVGVALWSGTATTKNLLRSGRATLSCIVGPTAYNVRLRARPRDDGAGRLTTFDCRVESADSDVVEYAELETGARFRLLDPPAAIERWRQTLESLRQAG